MYEIKTEAHCVSLKNKGWNKNLFYCININTAWTFS